MHVQNLLEELSFVLPLEGHEAAPCEECGDGGKKSFLCYGLLLGVF